jgi:hypothetical protein
MDKAPHGARPLLDTCSNFKEPKLIVLTCDAHVGATIQVTVAVLLVSAKPSTHSAAPPIFKISDIPAHRRRGCLVGVLDRSYRPRHRYHHQCHHHHRHRHHYCAHRHHVIILGLK